MRKGLIIGITVVAACCAVAFGVHHEMRRTAQMRTTLAAFQAANQADSVFTTDSLALELVRFFDHPLRFWTSANDRLMAHYLLGRCYADMGEAPRAIEEYSEAVEQADTTASDCDLRTLRAVYGQMANVFHQQNLPKEEIEANRNYCNLSCLLGDSTGFILGYSNLIRPYYLLGDTNKVLAITREVEQMSLSRADTMCAAWLNVVATYIYILRGQLTTAQQKIGYIRKYSGIFDSQGNLRTGREMFYYTIGLYFENTHQLDYARP